MLRHGDTRGAPCVRCASEVLAHGGDQRRGRDVCGDWHVRVLSGLQGLVAKIVKLTGRNLRHRLWMCGPKNYNSPTTQSRVATTSGRTPKAARDCYGVTQWIPLRLSNGLMLVATRLETLTLADWLQRDREPDRVCIRLRSLLLMLRLKSPGVRQSQFCWLLSIAHERLHARLAID